VGAEPGGGTTAKNADCHSALASTDSTTTRYCYDEFDRLRRQRGPNATTEQKFEYDGLDRRDKSTTVTGGTDATPTGFSYLGTSSTLSGETVRAGSTDDAVSVDRDSAGTPLAVTQQLGAAATPSTKTFATDANGNPTGLEDATGGVARQDRYVYDPYGDLQPQATGDPAQSDDARNNPLRFNGFDYDSSVKTYDMQARDYRPDTGRFLQSDRYESSQSDLSLVANPLTQDRYDFAGGNPVDNVEFDGHIPGAGSGCATTYCGDNQGGNMTTATKGKDKGESTNVVTSNASGTTRAKRIDNPAAQQVTYSASPQGKAQQAARRKTSTAAAQKILGTNCIEVCSNGERADNVARLSRALNLGLSPNQVEFHKGSDSTDATNNDLLNPVDLATGALVGGGGKLLLKGATRGARALLGGLTSTGTDAAGSAATDSLAATGAQELPALGGGGAGRIFATTSRGTTFDIPENFAPRPAANGKGIVYQRVGAKRNADSIRIMEQPSSIRTATTATTTAVDSRSTPPVSAETRPRRITQKTVWVPCKDGPNHEPPSYRCLRRVATTPRRGDHQPDHR
jgi:RHS repeat-associated protein